MTGYAVPGVPQGHRAARDAGDRDYFHHRLHHLLERLRVRDLADLDIAAQTVPAAISSFPGVSQFSVPYGDIAAAAVVVTVPVMLLVLIFQRRIVAGLTRAQSRDSQKKESLTDMAEIQFEDVTKRYADGFEAVKHLNLDVPDGELMILVGPSGCGKSTALRMVAGLEDISDGELKIGGEVVNDKAPKDRDIAMVFQNYALYPHMTVRENMGFALKLAKTPPRDRRKVDEAAKILDLEEHLDRKPANLSGGQRQRVAMGRAIVRSPKVFLMDEPLSNLDAKLRVQMRTEIAGIQQRLETTTIYVTHDQIEAMTSAIGSR